MAAEVQELWVTEAASERLPLHSTLRKQLQRLCFEALSSSEAQQLPGSRRGNTADKSRSGAFPENHNDPKQKQKYIYEAFLCHWVECIKLTLVKQIAPI